MQSFGYAPLLFILSHGQPDRSTLKPFSIFSALSICLFASGDIPEHSGDSNYFTGTIAFESNREGNFERLTELGMELGYEVQAIGPVKNGTDVLSSSLVRQRIRNGEVAHAAENLGRFYSLSGPVVHGDGRGRKINIPTANVDYPKDKVIPAFGVYACWAWVGGEKHPAAVNIGINPTFTPDKETPNVEAHLLDFSRELYGDELELEFVQRLRDEMKFDGVEALLKQIHADISKTRDILK